LRQSAADHHHPSSTAADNQLRSLSLSFFSADHQRPSRDYQRRAHLSFSPLIISAPAEITSVARIYRFSPLIISAPAEITSVPEQMSSLIFFFFFVVPESSNSQFITVP